MSSWPSEAEKKLRTMDQNSEEYQVYAKAKDAIDLSTGYSGPLNLHEKYQELKTRFFDVRVPELSDDFLVVFQHLPYDTSGMTIMQDDERFQGIKGGIRINQRLEMFPSETQVALLHEMIHASGIPKHNDDFRREVLRLLAQGAYGNLTVEGEYDGIL